VTNVPAAPPGWAGRWTDAPLSVRGLVGAYVVVFGYGTIVHIVQLAVAPTGPYPGTPAWLAAYFVSLTLWDPLAAVLLLRRRRAGLRLGCVVLVTDAIANGFANYGLPTGSPLGRVGHAVITLLALGAVLTAPALSRWLHPVRRAA
jgi:hypothetical protein